MQPRHLPVLDGLRAVAILLVLWCHIPMDTEGYPQWLKTAHAVVGPGGVGVDIFFVLSGFLITRILIRERDGDLPVRWFLLRRVLRIFPIYYLLLLVMLFTKPSIELAWCAAYLSNLHSILEPKFVPALGHTWSLCIEEHFYLLWPLVVAFTPRGSPKWLLSCLVMPFAILTAYWMVCHYGSIGANPDETMMAVQHASPVRFLSLGAGSLVAYAEPRVFAAPRSFTVLALALLIPAVYWNPVVHYLLLPKWVSASVLASPQHAPLIWLFHSACFSTSILLLCLTMGNARWSPLRLLRTAPMGGIGRISYGLYLYHLPIFAVLIPRNSPWPTTAFAVVVSFATAMLSYFVVERPILRHGARFRANRLSTPRTDA